MAAKDIEKHQFKKGQSGNKKGRPKMPDLADAIAEVIGEEGVRDILRALQAKAKKGSEKASEILMDRIYGKAKQSIQMEGNLSGEVTIKRVIKTNGDKP